MPPPLRQNPPAKDKAALEGGQKTIKVDTQNMGRGVWIVKVPKYVADVWQQAPSNMTVAKLAAEKAPNQKRKLNLVLTDECLKLAKTPLPNRHYIDMKEMTGQDIAIMSQTFKSDELLESNVCVEGYAAQKMECRPYSDKAYINMKIDAFKKAAEPSHKVQQLDKVVANYRPVKDHYHNIEYREKQKAEGKRFRSSKDEVIGILMMAFEKKDYYSLHELVDITRQPVMYLKQILNEIGDFYAKNPHKNMWHLKPEYRTVRSTVTIQKTEDKESSDDDCVEV